MPDLTFTSNTTVFRFAVDDIELAFIVFWPPFGEVDHAEPSVTPLRRT